MEVERAWKAGIVVREENQSGWCEAKRLREGSTGESTITRCIRILLGRTVIARNTDPPGGVAGLLLVRISSYHGLVRIQTR